MLNIILALTLINGGGGGGGGGLPQVGDTLSVWVDDFNLILGRHKETAQVRGLTQDLYILFPYVEIPIRSINSFHGYVVAGSDGASFYTSTNYGSFWQSAAYYNNYAKHVIIDSVLVGSQTNVVTFVAGYDTVGYAMTFGASATPVVNDTLGQVFDISMVFSDQTHNIIGAVLYAATEHGIAVIHTHVAPPLWTFEFSLGGVTDSTFAVYATPDSVYAGRSDGLYVWDGSSWSQISGVNGKVGKIERCNSGLLIATNQGLFLYSGGNVQQIATGDVLDVAAVGGKIGIVKNDTLYLTSDGGTTWEPQDIPAEVYSVGALADENTFLAGTKIGVYRYYEDQHRWMNVSEGIGAIVSDARVEALLATAGAAFDGIPDSVSSLLGVSRDSIYDADGDSRIYLYTTSLVISGNVGTRFIPAYFDPHDEDTSAEDTMSSRRELIVINKMQFNAFTDTVALRRLLTYFYSKYVVWALDQDEEAWASAGMSSLLTFLVTGIDMKNGLDESCSVESNPNQYPFTYPTDWRPTPLVRDGDRDRLFLFYEYVYERFGLDFVKSLFTNEDNGLKPIQEKLEMENIELADFIEDWQFANYIDNPDSTFYDGKYGYRNIDIEVTPAAFSPDGNMYTVMPWGAIFLQNTGETNVFVFNAQDDAELNLYLIDKETNTINPISLDDRKRARIEFPANEVVMIYQPALKNPKFYASADTIVPEPDTGIFIMQNKLMPHVVDAYLATTGLVYSDLLKPYPEMWAFYNADTFRYPMSLYTYHDVYLYNVQTPMEVPEGAERRFDVVMYYQDLSGNEKLSDTTELVIKRFLESGGSLAIDGGNCIISVPVNAFNFATTVVAVANPRVNPVINGEDGVSKIYTIGNGSMTLNVPAEITIRVPSDLMDDPAIYRWNGNTWEALSTVYDPVRHVVIARTDKLGSFQVRYGTPESLVLNFAVRNPITSKVVAVDYSLPEVKEVRMAVYDLTGRLVRELYNGKLNAGKGTIIWDLRDNNGASVGSGIYFLNVKAGEFNRVNKVVIVR